jgi:hypothetical protein
MLKQLIAGPLLLCSACTVFEPAPELPFFGNGLRFDGDPCRRLGENELTVDWLDDSRDLVGCPTGFPAEDLAAVPGATVLARISDTVVISVPRRR